MTKKWLYWVAIVALVAVLAACGSNANNGKSGSNQGSQEQKGANTSANNSATNKKENEKKEEPAKDPVKETAKEIVIRGAGASFPHPLFQSMFYDYNQQFPNVRVEYESIGSGGGQRALLEGTVNFAASDAFMKDEDMTAIKGGVVHVPITIGAVAVIYSVDGVDKGLKLTQDTLTKIYLGEITKWNDAAIQAENPEVTLPDQAITVVYRSDSSGTTSIFTNYLSAVSPTWSEKIGAGTAVEWPVGVGANKNDGVAAQVSQTPGAIGYVEYAFASENNLPYASLRNKDGNFVLPSQEAATLAAAAAAENMPQDTRVSLVEMGGADSYGIVGVSWVLLYGEYEDAEMKQAVLDLVKWMYRDGQVHADPLHYAQIPEEIAKINDSNLEQIK